MGTSVTFAVVCLVLALGYFLCPTRDPVSVVHQDNSTIRFNISGSEEVLDLTKCGGQVQSVVAFEEFDEVFGRPILTLHNYHWIIECFKEAKEMMDRNKMSFQDIACINGICKASLYVPNAKALALNKIQVWVIDGKVPSIKMCETTKSTAELDEMNCTASTDDNKQYTGIPCHVNPGEQKCFSHVVDLSTGTVEEVESDPNAVFRSIFGFVDMFQAEVDAFMNTSKSVNGTIVEYAYAFMNTSKSVNVTIVEDAYAWASNMTQSIIS